MQCIEFQRSTLEFDAVHRILVERHGSFHWNSMHCIEFQLNGPLFQLEFDAVHRILVERYGLSTRIRCTASNSSILRWNSMQCIEFQLKDTGLSTGIRCTASNSSVVHWNSMHCIEFHSFQREFDALHRIPVEIT